MPSKCSAAAPEFRLALQPGFGKSTELPSNSEVGTAYCLPEISGESPIVALILLNR
jgi:hypothetical protein